MQGWDGQRIDLRARLKERGGKKKALHARGESYAFGRHFMCCVQLQVARVQNEESAVSYLGIVVAR